MRKLHTPKRVTLPNGRTFLTRYKRVPRSEPPANVTLARRYGGRVQVVEEDHQEKVKEAVDFLIL